jgi:hypothetical protein
MPVGSAGSVAAAKAAVQAGAFVAVLHGVPVESSLVGGPSEKGPSAALTTDCCLSST